MANSLEILETSLYVNNLDAAESFYRDALGLTFVSRQATRHVFSRCGSTMLLIFNAAESRKAFGEIPAHGADGPGHVAFSIAHEEVDSWASRLQEHGIEIEKQVAWPNGGCSIYFRDPAGNSLELATRDLWSPGASPDAFSR